MISSNQSPIRDDKEEEMSRSALAMFRAKEEEIERKKMEVRDKVHAYLGRVEEETKRLAEIREVSQTILSPLILYLVSSKHSCFTWFFDLCTYMIYCIYYDLGRRYRIHTSLICMLVWSGNYVFVSS